jgi:hypothetical protein
MGVDSPSYREVCFISGTPRPITTAINMLQDRDQASATRTETVKLRKLKDSGGAPHVLQDLPRNCRLFFMVEHTLVRETS